MKPKDKTKTLEQTVAKACIDAGSFVRENIMNIQTVEWKKLDDPVTNLDRDSELMICNSIKKNIDANFYGEEYGIQNNNARTNIYIDPIDGTKSFIRGEYMTSTSIAAEVDGELIYGIVYDFMRDIAYTATRKGAYITFFASKNMSELNETSESLNHKKLPFFDPKLSKPTLTATQDHDPKLEEIEKKLGEITKRNSMGSIALYMAQLAAGCYDGLIKGHYTKGGVSDMCDIVAGYFIMKQAGLTIKDYDSKEFNYKSINSSMIAMKPELYEKMN